MKRISYWCAAIAVCVMFITIICGCDTTIRPSDLNEVPMKKYYSIEHFESIIKGESTYHDVYSIAPTENLQVTSYGGFCEYPTHSGGYIRIKFYGTELIVSSIEEVALDSNHTKKDETTMGANEIDKETQVTLNSSEIFAYSDEQLSEIAELADTKDKLIEQYPTAYTRTVSIVQNDMSNAKSAVEMSYRGETKVLRLMFDGVSGNKISSHFYSTFCSKNEFDTLAIGQLLSDVQTIDPKGEYYFLYTGRNDVPRVSTHYTTDGFVISITYDKNNVIEKIDIVPM